MEPRILVRRTLCANLLLLGHVEGHKPVADEVVVQRKFSNHHLSRRGPNGRNGYHQFLALGTGKLCYRAVGMTTLYWAPQFYNEKKCGFFYKRSSFARNVLGALRMAHLTGNVPL